jgi:predicted nucleic acid-binding protein
MTVRAFADSNLFIYAESDDGEKSAIATALIEAQPVTSVQAINETVNVLTRKYGFTLAEAHEVAESLLDLCEVVPLDVATVREAIRLVRRYRFSHWDSLIVAAALLAGCERLYSEDLQHGQVIDGRLTIVNPFV